MANKNKNFDYVVDIDDYSLNEEEKSLFEEPKKRETQLKRWFLTINNPFWSEVNVEVDMSTNTLPVNYEYYNLDYLKSFNNIDLFDFHFVKVKANVKERQKDKVLKEVESEDGDKKYIEIEVEKEVIVEKEFVVERPYYKSYEHFKQYIENLQIEGLKYAVGQVEQGHKEETVHIQCGVTFDETHGKRFYTMKKYFPTAYLAQARGSNFDIKKYCTKIDTRVEEPFEFGDFVEMRKRTDYEEFHSALKSGATDEELLENFYTLTSTLGFEKINKQRDVMFNSKYKKEYRNLETTYIYGESGVGKTTFIYEKFGFENVFRVSYYGKFQFNGYNGEKILLLDEFAGQVNLGWLNQILDGFPLKLEVKGGERIACFEKVFICSNFSFFELYGKQQEENPRLYETVFRRVHHIFRVDNKGNFIKEKESVFEDIPENEVKLKGRTKRVSQSFKFDAVGQRYLIYDCRNYNQMQIEEIKNLETLPFDENDDEGDDLYGE